MRFLTLKIACITIFSLLSFSVLAQSRKQKKADEAFAAGEYLKAIELYEKSYAKEKTRQTKGHIAFYLAESYANINQARDAAKWYKRAIRGRYPNTEAVIKLADNLKKKGEYQEAIEEYENYKLLVPDDNRADIGIESCKQALDWIEKPTRYKVEEFKDINSSQSDFAPFFLRGTDELIFTSTRENAKGDKMNTASGQYFADIYKTSKDRKGNWSEPVSISDVINTPFDEGAASLNADFDEIYYTSCQLQKDNTTRCGIYLSQKKQSEWTAPVFLNLVQDSTKSFGHPAISPDGLTLMFVADIPNGAGLKDIWVVTRTSKTASWGTPKNMGSQINTTANEMYPYIQSDTTIFFASDGHPGMGGLDIFRATKRNEKWVVENMKSPINSYADDFSIIFEPEENRGYFSSSRDKEDNIYTFDMPPLQFSIAGVVKNEKNDIVLAGAEIKMTGSNGTVLQTTSANDGTFSFKLKPETDYLLVSSKNKYLKGKTEETTKGLKNDQVIEVILYMAPIDQKIELPNILYDFGKATLRPESMVALDRLVETLNVNPNITIELGAHTDFRGNDDDNLELSQRRAQSVVDYLIKNGIVMERLTAKGYGESLPNTVNEKIARKHNFLQVGDTLTEAFITELPQETQREIAHQINRRTEFKVLRTDFNVKAIPFGEGGTPKKEDDDHKND